MLGGEPGCHVGGELRRQRLHRGPVAQVAALQHGVAGGAAERGVDGGGHALGVHTVEGLGQALHRGRREPLCADLQALRRHGLPVGAHVVAGVDDVVVPAPGARADGGVAGPGDRWEVDDRAPVQHGGAGQQAAQVGQALRVARQAVFQLGLVQPVAEEHVQPARLWAPGVQHLVRGAAVLAGEVHVGRDAAFAGHPAGAVGAVDQWEAERGQARRCDVHRADGQRVTPPPHAGPAEPQWGPRLADVQRPVGAGLGAAGPVLRGDRQVGGVGAVEQLGDALVAEGVALVLGGDEAARRVVGIETARCRRGPLGVDGGQRQRILVSDRVLAEHLQHLEPQRPAVVHQATEPDHAPG